MELKTQVLLTIVFAVAIWSICLLLTGAILDWKLLTPFGVTVSVVTTGSLLFVNHFWKVRYLQRWLISRPDLGGTWKARLISTYKIDGVPVEKTVYVVIRQDLVKLSFRLYTEKARSSSLAAEIAKDGSDLYRLAVSYQNVPNVEHRGVDSEIHFGAALFEHIDFDAAVIEGHYWTDRNTNGSLVLLDRRPKAVSTFENAAALFA